MPCSLLLSGDFRPRLDRSRAPRTCPESRRGVSGADQPGGLPAILGLLQHGRNRRRLRLGRDHRQPSVVRLVPVASAVAPAAESVTPSRESVFSEPTAPHGMAWMNSGDPLTRRPISTCSGPMPSPVNRTRFFGFALAGGLAGFPAAGEATTANVTAINSRGGDRRTQAAPTLRTYHLDPLSSGWCGALRGEGAVGQRLTICNTRGYRRDGLRRLTARGRSRRGAR
jgi:hypothetical protein